MALISKSTHNQMSGSDTCVKYSLTKSQVCRIEPRDREVTKHVPQSIHARMTSDAHVPLIIKSEDGSEAVRNLISTELSNVGPCIVDT